MIYTSKNHDKIYISEKNSDSTKPTAVVFKVTDPDGEIYWKTGLPGIDEKNTDFQKVIKEFDLATVNSYGEYSSRTVMNLLFEYAALKQVPKSKYFPPLAVGIDMLVAANSSMCSLTANLAENLNNIEYISSHPWCMPKNYVTACQRNMDGTIVDFVAGGIGNPGINGDFLNWNMKFSGTGLLEFKNPSGLGNNMSLTINVNEFEELLSKYECCKTYDKLLLLLNEVWEKYGERIAFVQIIIPPFFDWIDDMGSQACLGIAFLKTQKQMDEAVRMAKQQQPYAFQQPQTVNPYAQQCRPQYFGGMQTDNSFQPMGQPSVVIMPSQQMGQNTYGGMQNCNPFQPMGQTPYGGTNPYCHPQPMTGNAFGAGSDLFSDYLKRKEKKSENKKEGK